LVLRIERERPVAGVELVGALNDEEPVAVQRQVGRLAGGLEGAVAEVLLDRRDDRAQPPLTRVGAAEVVVRRRPAVVGHVKLRLEQGPAALERDRVDVGDVVADHVEPRLVDVEAREAGEQRAGECHVRYSCCVALRAE
jgi:hypothetical protein